jgi:hypothetical protein
LQRERTRRKTLETRERINNKLNSNMMLSQGIEPEITVVRGEHLAATPPMLPINVASSTYLSLYHYGL